MRPLVSIVLLLVLMLMTGCGFANRHPMQVKVYALVGGAAIGAGIGLATRIKFCHYQYEGQPYYGSDCPAPSPARRIK